jgi:hypothetical protein
VIHGAHLDEAAVGADVDARDVFPRPDFERGLGHGRLEDLVRSDRDLTGLGLDLGRLDPRHFLLQLQEQAGADDHRDGRAMMMEPQ